MYDTEDVAVLLDDFADTEFDCSGSPTDSRNYNAIIFFANVLKTNIWPNFGIYY